MLIAEEVCKNGMAATGEFLKHLTALIASNGITKVIETGTYLGTGSTKAIIDGLKMHKKPFHFISIEVNPEHHRKAQRNVGRIQGVELWNGCSINKDHPLISTDFSSLPDHVVIDHQPENRTALYEKEVAFNVPENLLKNAVDFFDGKPELVILDSAGHFGWAEFNVLFELINNPFILALDDINHGKHYWSMETIRKSPETFQVIFETNDKFGSAIIKVKC